MMADCPDTVPVLLADILRAVLHPELLARIEAEIDARIAREVDARAAPLADLPLDRSHPAEVTVEATSVAPPVAAPIAGGSVRASRPARRRGCFTPERDAIIAREWPLGTPVIRVAELVNALPGPAVSDHAIATRASSHVGAKRPGGFSPHAGETRPQGRAPTPRYSSGTLATPERDALLRAEWPAGTLIDVIFEKINALPGPALSVRQINDRVGQLRLRRPQHFMSTMQAARWADKRPVAVAETEMAAVSEPQAETVAPAAKSAPAPIVAKTPPKIAPYVPPPAVAHKPPPLKTAAQIRRERDEAAVQAHIRVNGVTKCPTAMLEPTTATVSAAESAEIAAHNKAREGAAAADRAARMQRSLAAKRAAARAAAARVGR